MKAVDRVNKKGSQVHDASAPIENGIQLQAARSVDISPDTAQPLFLGFLLKNRNVKVMANAVSTLLSQRHESDTKNGRVRSAGYPGHAGTNNGDMSIGFLGKVGRRRHRLRIQLTSVDAHMQRKRTGLNRAMMSCCTAMYHRFTRYSSKVKGFSSDKASGSLAAVGDMMGRKIATQFDVHEVPSASVTVHDAPHDAEHRPLLSTHISIVFELIQTSTFNPHLPVKPEAR